MADGQSLCARCARHQRTCCQDTEVYVTVGDVQRIENYAARRDFYEFRAPSVMYRDQDDDIFWQDHVFRPDGTRRILKHEDGGDCTFLGPEGCTLPPDVRPLVCRLYPFEYTSVGIHIEPAPGCPLELLPLGQGLFETLDMKLDQARCWHAQLYGEISLEDGVTEGESAACISV